MELRTLSDAVVKKVLSLLAEYINKKISAFELATVVTELPTEDIVENRVYLVPSTESDTNNIYKEYLYINGAWEELGEFKAEIDLSPYSTTEQVQALITTAIDDLESKVNETLKNYVQFTDVATTESAGVMSADDKAKLDDITDYTEDEITALVDAVLA